VRSPHPTLCAPPLPPSRADAIWLRDRRSSHTRTVHEQHDDCHDCLTQHTASPTNRTPCVCTHVLYRKRTARKAHGTPPLQPKSTCQHIRAKPMTSKRFVNGQVPSPVSTTFSTFSVPHSKQACGTTTSGAERGLREETLVLQPRLLPAQRFENLRADHADEVLSGAGLIDVQKTARAASHRGEALE